jgi:thioredoxin reductase
MIPPPTESGVCGRGRRQSREAAIVLARDLANRVVLSYRRPYFFRMRRQNLRSVEHLRQKAGCVILNSEVRRIEPNRVILAVRQDAAEIEKRLPVSAVFVLIGGDPPFELLRSIGIRFGGSSDGKNTGTSSR